ncbi:MULTISPECIES: nuclear transport factor 2 family protein [Acidiphilium]|jgi:ketosteroid isomerase-like protein|uniref:SnoaL-like domain-containing protein n=1 Tax=Acidiphilium cryptum (strain JF-5) TaxID=349163 RepID=A5FVD4_ACICJ|nr:MULTISPECIES: nuclear transport factor 2 family protein [Acidiphilium]ABQ29566.1 protein of unknown function DUF1486 [Acidiphilium cryptum JF-5]MBU6356580.1 nuclear transport factor 2 family protein [Rhodospirillales bacterium]
MDNRTPDRSPSHLADAAKVFAAIDRQDAAAFASLFANNGMFVFGNAAPVIGPAAIRAAVTAFFAAIRELRHDIIDVWHVGDSVITQLTVLYRRRDGSVVSLPAATIWRVSDLGITDYRIYADLAPLVAPSD